MILRRARGWLLFDENYLLLGLQLPVWLFTVNVLDNTPWGFWDDWRALSVLFWKTARRNSLFVLFCFFFASAAFPTRHNTDLDKLPPVHFLLIMEANVLQCILCNCLCSSYAAYARGSILSDVICSPRASSTVHCAFVTLWVLPLGIEKLPINPFLCFSRILQCICEKWVASGGVELFGVFFRDRAENAPWNCSFASRLLHTRVHYLSITSSSSIESYSPGPF